MLGRKEQLARVPAGPSASRRRRGRGFSLLEMLLAAAVLAAALLIVMESISFALTAAARMDRDQIAYRIAADRLERAAAGEYPSLPAEGQSGLAGAEYRWRVQAGPEADGLRPLRCIVRWESLGRGRTVMLSRHLPSRQEGGSSP